MHTPGVFGIRAPHRPTLIHAGPARRAAVAIGAAAVRGGLAVLGVSAVLVWLGAAAWVLVQLVSWWILLPHAFPAMAVPPRPWW
jgi:hypothetical protein